MENQITQKTKTIGGIVLFINIITPVLLVLLTIGQFDSENKSLTFIWGYIYPMFLLGSLLCSIISLIKHQKQTPISFIATLLISGFFLLLLILNWFGIIIL